jgi:hypothetical protein
MSTIKLGWYFLLGGREEGHGPYDLQLNRIAKETLGKITQKYDRHFKFTEYGRDQELS